MVALSVPNIDAIHFTAEDASVATVDNRGVNFAGVLA
jgi:hypothetical protein